MAGPSRSASTALRDASRWLASCSARFGILLFKLFGSCPGDFTQSRNSFKGAPGCWQAGIFERLHSCSPKSRCPRRSFSCYRASVAKGPRDAMLCPRRNGPVATHLSRQVTSRLCASRFGNRRDLTSLQPLKPCPPLPGAAREATRPDRNAARCHAGAGSILHL